MDITITDKAVAKIVTLLETQQQIDDLDHPPVLRIFVKGGGCSGFQYTFKIEEEPNDDDFIVEKDGAVLIVDPLSSQYMDGLELDYEQELVGEHFKIKNPNATTTCGCGSSFGA